MNILDIDVPGALTIGLEAGPERRRGPGARPLRALDDSIVTIQ